MNSMELVKYKKARFEKNKLTLDDNITIDEWKELGQQLKQVEGSVQFWIGDWARFGDKKGYYTNPKVYDELEEITGLERQTIQQYKSIAGKLDTNLRSPDLSFNHHREVASLEPAQQKKFLDKASDENLSVRDLRREIRLEKILNNKPKLLEGKYRIFYADPPWEYGDKQDIESLGGANKHYPTMSLDELCDLPIPNIAEDNAVLFLWVTVI